MSDEINEKMEQIRLKNEELEKKHKAIMEDELEAKKLGAAVQKSQAVSCKSTEKHRLDDVELDFDVKDEQRELAKNPDYKPKNRRPILGKKQIDEIPSDPVNFLRDDGEEKAENNQNKRTSHNNRDNRNRHRNPRPRHNDGENDTVNYEKSSESTHRPRNHQNNRPKSQHNNRNNFTNEDSTLNQETGGSSPRKTHPQQLRERRSVQSTESTDDSTSEPNKSAQQQHRPKRPTNNNSRPRARPNKEKNDITVEVTDEVRSVKLKTSERTFGTGRVRPKTENYENSESFEEKQQQQPSDGKKYSRPYQRNRKGPKGPPQQSEFQHPILDKIVITKTSVQDRLLRSKMLDDKTGQEPKIETESNAPVEN